MPQKSNVRLIDVNGVVNPVTGGTGQAVDGFTVAAGYAVLLVNPPNGSAYAGPWIAASGGWSRATDWDTTAEITPGDSWYVEQGNEYQGTLWHFENTSAPATLNTDPLTIGQFTERRIAEPGNGIIKSGTTPPVWSWTSPSDVQTTFIEGLRLSYVSANSIRIEGGACYIPASGVVNSDVDIDLTSLTLTSGVLYHLYAFDAGGGVLSVDAPSTQAPASTPYREGARTKGPDLTPDLTRRYIGSFFASAANTIARFAHRLPDTIVYDQDTGTGSFRVVTSGTPGATFATVNCNAVVPVSSRRAIGRFNNLAGATVGQIGNTAGTADRYSFPASGFWIDNDLLLNSSQQFFHRYSAGAPGSGLTTDILGYRFER